MGKAHAPVHVFADHVTPQVLRAVLHTLSTVQMPYAEHSCCICGSSRRQPASLTQALGSLCPDCKSPAYRPASLLLPPGNQTLHQGAKGPHTMVGLPVKAMRK